MIIGKLLTSYFLQQVVFFDILEVLVGGNLQLVGSRFVSYNDAVLVHLQGLDGPFVRHSSLYGSLHGAGLVVTVNQNHYLAGIHNGAYTNG